MFPETITENRTIIEASNSDDLDIFLYDDEKIIHIATAGMKLINRLNEIDYDLQFDRKKVLAYRRRINFETNPGIKRKNIIELKYYKYFFELMALRGFYSYDKVNIDNPLDYKFQLISRPIYESEILVSTDKYNQIVLGDRFSSKSYNYDINFIKAKKNFPSNFRYFDLKEYV